MSEAELTSMAHNQRIPTTPQLPQHCLALLSSLFFMFHSNCCSFSSMDRFCLLPLGLGIGSSLVWTTLPLSLHLIILILQLQIKYFFFWITFPKLDQFPLLPIFKDERHSLISSQNNWPVVKIASASFINKVSILMTTTWWFYERYWMECFKWEVCDWCVWMVFGSSLQVKSAHFLMTPGLFKDVWAQLCSLCLLWSENGWELGQRLWTKAERI